VFSNDHKANINTQHIAGQNADCECVCVFVCVCARLRWKIPARSVHSNYEVRVYTLLDRLHSWIMCSDPVLCMRMSNEIFEVY
jgi:hypothetical protein